MQEINLPDNQDSSQADAIIKAMKVSHDPRDNNKLPEQKFNEIEAQYDLLKQVRSGVHCKFIIEHDGQELPMRLISEEEQQECFLKALAEFYKLPEYCRIHTHLIDRYNMIYILEKALSSSPLNPADGQVFMTLKALKSMTSASLSSLFAKYTAMDKQLNPCVDELTDAEFDFFSGGMRKKARISEQIIGIAIAEDSSYLHQTPHLTKGQITYYLLWRSWLNKKRQEEEAKQIAFLEKVNRSRNNRG